MRKRILTLLLIVCSIIVNAQVKNLDKFPIAKRDSILLEIAKSTVMKYGPEFYEVNQPPLIERKVVPEGYENVRRVRFIITYPYKEEFYKKYPSSIGGGMVKVYIWEDSGLVYSIVFDGSLGYDNLDKPQFKRTDGKRLIMKRNPMRSVEVDDTTKTVKK